MTQNIPTRWILFASLAFNLVLVGGAIGAYAAGVRLHQPGPDALIAQAPGPRAFMESLPPEMRAALRNELRVTWRATTEERREAREARAAAYEIALAEPYDADAARAAFARMRAADQVVLGAFHDDVAVVLDGLSAEQRRTSAEALRNAMDRRERIRTQWSVPEEGAQMDRADPRSVEDLTPEERRARLREFIERRRAEEDGR